MKSKYFIVLIYIGYIIVLLVGFHLGRSHYFKNEFVTDMYGDKFVYIQKSECEERIAHQWAEDLVNSVEMMKKIRQEAFADGINSCSCNNGGV